MTRKAQANVFCLVLAACLLLLQLCVVSFNHNTEVEHQLTLIQTDFSSALNLDQPAPPFQFGKLGPSGVLNAVDYSRSMEPELLNDRRFFSNATRLRKQPGPIITRFRKSWYGTGYSPFGGPLPEDDHQLFPDEGTWPTIDNGTCLESSPQPFYSWQLRHPHAILIGTMKGGTHALSEYLWQHPWVTPSTRGSYELHFFDSKWFHRNESGISQRRNQIAYAQRVRRMYPQLPPDTVQGFDRSNTTYRVTIHDSPRYLLWSDRIPEAILCVTPWAKLLAILRHPIERAISHFRFQDEGTWPIEDGSSGKQRDLTHFRNGDTARLLSGYPMVDWEAWIYDDLRLLREAGVVQNWTEVDFDSYAGSYNETIAWKRYLRTPNSQMIVGRGLYAIQLEHYFSALAKAGKNASYLLVLQSEELRNNTQAVYDRVLAFLDLPPHHLLDTREKHQTNSEAPPMPDRLRSELSEFYKPYNRRLYKLLGWDAVWD